MKKNLVKYNSIGITCESRVGICCSDRLMFFKKLGIGDSELEMFEYAYLTLNRFRLYTR